MRCFIRLNTLDEDRPWEPDGDKVVMDYLNAASDNEIAMIGCLAAMVGSLGLMLISGTVFGRSQSGRRQVGLPGRVRGEASRRAEPRTRDQEAA